jgi:hypothetical protein
MHAGTIFLSPQLINNFCHWIEVDFFYFRSVQPLILCLLMMHLLARTAPVYRDD